MSDDVGNGSSAGEEVKENLKSRGTWLRLVYMILFAVAFYLAEIVLVVVVVLQFLWKLFSGDTNARLTSFGDELGRYLYQIVRFLTFNTEEMPFPQDDWPGAAPASESKPKRKRAITPKAE